MKRKYYLLAALVLTACPLIIVLLSLAAAPRVDASPVFVQDLGCYYSYRTLSVGSYDPSRTWSFQCGKASSQATAKQQCVDHVTDLGLNPRYSCRCVGCDISLPPPPIQIEFMASDVSWDNSEYVGHAFVCISIPTGASIKEDCYGFYPRSSSSAFIGGPGVTTSEFIKNPSRFSRVTASMKKPLTEEQRRQVLKLVNEWNGKNYNLTKQSCIDFVNDVAKALGWNTPERVVSDFPDTYMKKLSEKN